MVVLTRKITKMIVIVNWKRSKQGLPWINLRFYSLLDLSMNQLSSEIPTLLGSM